MTDTNTTDQDLAVIPTTVVEVTVAKKMASVLVIHPANGTAWKLPVPLDSVAAKLTPGDPVDFVLRRPTVVDGDSVNIEAPAADQRDDRATARANAVRSIEQAQRCAMGTKDYVAVAMAWLHFAESDS